MSDAPFVFISYAIEDLKAAKKIAEALKSLAIDYWLDESRIRPGAQWQRQTEFALENCACAIFVASQHSLTKSGFVARERDLLLDRARARAETSERPFLFTVMLADLDLVGTGLDEFQYIELKSVEALPTGKVLRFTDLMSAFEEHALDRERAPQKTFTDQAVRNQAKPPSNRAPKQAGPPYTPNGLAPLFHADEMDIYCNKTTGEAHIFYGKEIDLGIKEIQYFESTRSAVVEYNDGRRFDLGVKIQWLVRPYFSRAEEVSFVRTANREPIDGEVVRFRNIEHPHEFGSNLAISRRQKTYRQRLSNVFNFLKRN